MGPGEESFDVVVCNPLWLHGAALEEGALLGPHYVIVASFDWPRLRRFLTREVESCHGADWAEVATKLGRIGRWEFEDYVG